MQRYRVKCFKDGIWDEAADREVDAEEELQAADHACGGSLIDSGTPGRLRAQVWEPNKLGAKRLFYIPPNSN